MRKMFNRRCKANKQNLKNTFCYFRYFITGAMFMAIGIISSCATISYSYTDKGIFLTSDPPGALVEILFEVRYMGHIKTVKLYADRTPTRNPNDQFVQTAIHGDKEIDIRYKITVSKDGYKTITQEIKSEDIRPIMHWTLEPIKGK